MKGYEAILEANRVAEAVNNLTDAGNFTRNNNDYHHPALPLRSYPW